MSIRITPRAIASAFAGGTTSILIPAETVRRLILEQPPVSAFGDHFQVEVVEAILSNGTVTLHLACSGDATIALGAIPLPPVRAAVAANELLDRPVKVTPRFVVSLSATPYLAPDRQSLHAPLTDVTVVNFQPLHGAPFGLGNLLTDSIGSVIGTTYRASSKVVGGVTSVASRGVGSIRTAADAATSKVAGLLPKRFRRPKGKTVEPATETVSTEKDDVTTALDQAVVKVDGFSGNPKTLLLRLVNKYVNERPVLVLPESYRGESIAGLVRSFNITAEGIWVSVDVNGNVVWRRRRLRLLYGVLALVCLVGIWIVSG